MTWVQKQFRYFQPSDYSNIHLNRCTREDFGFVRHLSYTRLYHRFNQYRLIMFSVKK